jgi:hypothetical protein
VEIISRESHQTEHFHTAWTQSGLSTLENVRVKSTYVDDLELPQAIDRGIPIRPFGLNHCPVSISVWCEHDDQAARPPPSSFFSPRATIIKASSGRGR